MFISIDQLEESEKRYDALQEEPVRNNVAAFSDEALIADVPPEVTRGNILGTDENLTKRKEMLETIGQEPVDFALRPTKILIL